MTSPPPHASGQGSGKLILFGEHAVVWGARALATSLPGGAHATLTPTPHSPTRLRLVRDGEPLASVVPDRHGEPLAVALAVLLDCFEDTSHLNLEVTLHVPPGAGLGSSAALATAIARALCTLHDVPDATARVARAVRASEDIFHSSASGIDQAAATGSGLILFRKGPPLECTPLHDLPRLHLAICQAEPGASTATMVNGVTSRRQRAPARYQAIASLISQLVDDALDAMRAQDLRSLGELMDFNHGLLCAMGVSTPKLDAACHIARDAGALGAKLTGAGGGGCLYALCEDAVHAEQLVATLHHHHLNAFYTTIAGPSSPPSS